jgi:hypothetical protein
MAKRAATKPTAPGEGTAKAWLERIDAALAREENTWRMPARKVVKRYRDERAKGDIANSTKINILWANTDILKSALYTRTSKPDVRRRFPDGQAGNTPARIAAEVIERALNYVIDTEAIDAVMLSAIEDLLLPGRGVIKISYEPEIAEPEEDDEEGGKEAGGGDVGAEVSSTDSGEKAVVGGEIVAQRLALEYVFWEDYCQGLARQDKDVPWRAFRQAVTKEQFAKKFPEAQIDGRHGPDANYQLSRSEDQKTGNYYHDEGFVELWEIWAIGGRKRLYVARGYTDILQETEDPYELTGFYPCPAPLRGVSTTDRQVPQPEFLQYQDQAIELDMVASRISRLTKEMRWRGIYDATLPDGAAPGGSTLADLAKADDGEFLPHVNFQSVRDRGGIAAAFGFMPLDMLVGVIEKLSGRQTQLIDEIYQITGISDIVRGQTDPNETFGAQKLKGQFGSLRLQARQREVKRFILDAYRMMAEIIAVHFTPETLAKMTGFDLPTAVEQQQLKQQIAQAQMQAALAQQAPQAPQSPPQQVPQQPGMPPAQPMGTPQRPPQPQAPPIDQKILDRANGPNWDDVIQLLRSDKLRSYRVDVETDDTEFQDAAEEQEQRVEFMRFFMDMMEKAYVAATTAPMMLPLIKEVFLYGMRTFKAGRSLEQQVEDAFDQLQRNPPPPQPQQGKGKGASGPDPGNIAKGQAAIADVQRKAMHDKAQVGLEAQRLQSEQAIAAHQEQRADALAQSDMQKRQSDQVMKAIETEHKIAKLLRTPGSPLSEPHFGSAR